MSTKVIGFYDKYECLAGSCPQTCCKGWKIIVDDAVYENYKKEKGIKGLGMCLGTRRDKDAGRVIRKVAGHCPFYTRDNLCGFQKEGRQELVPKVCRVYPRKCIDYGGESEITLELSCVAAAEVFLENQDKIGFIDSDKKIENAWTAGNKDEKFLQFLMKDRKVIKDYMTDGIFVNKEVNKVYGNISYKNGSYQEKIHRVFSYVNQENQCLARDDIEAAEAIDICCQGPDQQEEEAADSIKEHGRAKAVDSTRGYDKTKKAKGKSTEEATFMFWPIRIINTLVIDKLEESRKIYRQPVLTELLRNYNKVLGELRESEADRYIDSEIRKMLEQEPSLETLCCNYFSYLIQQSYCQAYKDYYLIGPVILAILQVELLMIFFFLQRKCGKELGKKEQAAIIATLERNIRHNHSLKAKLYDNFRRFIYLQSNI